MLKQEMLDLLKERKKQIEKNIKKGNVFTDPIFRDKKTVSELREITKYNLADYRRLILFLRGAVEFHFPNIPEITKSIFKEDDELLFAGLGLPFDNILVTFTEGNIKMGILVYPYKRFIEEMGPLDDDEGREYILENLFIHNGQIIVSSIKALFDFKEKGFAIHVSDMVNEIFSLRNDIQGFNTERQMLKFAATKVLALCRLLECKNIKIKKHEPAITGKEREYMRQNGFVCKDDFYTLTVTVGGEEVEYGESGASGASKRFHVCRGHFATYTEENKLFGKYVGKYWIPQHMKGNPDLGVIEKDYKLEVKDAGFT